MIKDTDPRAASNRLADRLVVVIVTLDTKGEEAKFLCDALRRHGSRLCVMDVGTLGVPAFTPDITRDEVARAAGSSVEVLAGDRGHAIRTMSLGAAAILRGLAESEPIGAAVSLGGSGNASIASTAMHELPIGIPKVLVSTVASGDTRPYVDGTDVALVYPVVDVVGLNRITTRILANMAAAVAAMARLDVQPISPRPLLTATMLGITTPCVDAARRCLEAADYEVLIFHATGTGGRSMEQLVRNGEVMGVLDVTLAEVVNDIVGGVTAAGPNRLEAAGAVGVPQVVVPGGLDTINWGPLETVPGEFRDRLLHEHNRATTLMRTSITECTEAARAISKKLNAASGPVALFLPLRGLSELDIAGGPFYDPDADAALFETLRRETGAQVELHELDLHINERHFGIAVAERLDQLCIAKRSSI